MLGGERLQMLDFMTSIIELLRQEKSLKAGLVRKALWKRGWKIGQVEIGKKEKKTY